MRDTVEFQTLLESARSGDQAAMTSVFEKVYTELRAMAGWCMRAERASHSLQPTELVHEAYTRLIGSGGPWQSPGHFFGSAAQAMRRVLIEHARARASLRRGGDQERPARRVSFDVIELTTSGSADDMLALDDAITRLDSIDAELAQLVRLRFFAGLTESHAAEVMGIPLRTAQRSWALAKAWLRRTLTDDSMTP